MQPIPILLSQTRKSHAEGTEVNAAFGQQVKHKCAARWADQPVGCDPGFAGVFQAVIGGTTGSVLGIERALKQLNCEFCDIFVKACR